MSADYEREKLGNAVDVLATSALPIQKRLEYAFTAMHTLRHHGLSGSERQEAFDSIYKQLTVDKSDEKAGHVPTTTARLSDNDASKLASEIVDLNSMLQLDRVWELEEEIGRFKAK